jgi:polar amino acid transport system substrate-binding protein
MLVGAGCATVSSPLPDLAAPMPRPTPNAPTTTPDPSIPGSSGGAGATVDCGNPTASLRPPAVLPPPGHPDGGTLQAIVRRGYLTAGIRPDTPPFGSLNPDTRQPEGFDVDIVNLIGRALFGSDGHVQFRAVTADQRISLVKDGTLDLTAATISITCDRAADVDFSEVYFMTATGVLVMKDTPYRGLDDLGGKKVCAARGTTSERRVRTSPVHPVAVPVTNFGDCLVLLQDGNDETVLIGTAAQDPETRIVGVSDRTTPMGIAVGKTDPDLTRFVNGVLEQAKRDGTWARRYQRWLGGAQAPPPPAATYRD